jgi:hypothetical protein
MKETEEKRPDERRNPEKRPGCRVHAKVVLCRCSERRSNDNLYGIRIEEQGGDWVRTWAFKIDEGKAKREGFDTERTTGSLRPTLEYPGCPYCGTMLLSQCDCGKLFCQHGERTPDGHIIQTCPWCGQTGDYVIVEKVNVQGGGM